MNRNLNYLIQAEAAQKMMPGPTEQLIVKEIPMTTPAPYDQARAEALADPYDEEVRDILWIDVLDRTRPLVARQKRDGGVAEAYFGRGITLRVTEKEARVIAENPTDETVAELERSGHNFLVVRDA